MSNGPSGESASMVCTALGRGTASTTIKHENYLTSSFQVLWAPAAIHDWINQTQVTSKFVAPGLLAVAAARARALGRGVCAVLSTSDGLKWCCGI